MVEISGKNVIILSIHPVFAEAMFKGEKRIEFRKFNIPKKVKYVVLYITSPEKKVAGYFVVKDIVEGTVLELWKNYSEFSGISKEKLIDYYGEKGIGRALLVDKIYKFEDPLALDQIDLSPRPPQSFKYLDVDSWYCLKNRKKILVGC